MDWKLIPDPYRGNRLANLRLQATVRLIVCLLTGAYYAVTAHLTEGLYLLFIAYTLTLLVVVQRAAETAADGLVLVTLCADHCFALVGLVVLGEHGYFLFFLLAQIGLGYGIRFGKNLLACSAVLTIFGMFAVTSLSDYWQASAHVPWTVATTIPLLFTYLYFLIDALTRSERRAAAAEAGLGHSVRFVSHDMRTQLQALRAVLRDIPQAAGSAALHRHTATAGDIVTSLARLSEIMLDRIASASERAVGGSATGDRGAAEARAEVTVGALLGAVAGRFSAQFAAAPTCRHAGSNGVAADRGKANSPSKWSR